MTRLWFDGPKGPACADVVRRFVAAVAVGVAEIAALLRVEAQTARNWRTRGVLPEPDWTVSGGPAWSWPRVAAWAMRTGRL